MCAAAQTTLGMEVYRCSTSVLRLSTTTLELRSLITREGELRLTLEDVLVAAPGPDEVIIRVDAAPINPSDLGTLLGPADVTTFSADTSSWRPVATAKIPSQFASLSLASMPRLSARR